MSSLDSLSLTAIPAQDEAIRLPVREFLSQAMRDVPARVRAKSWSGYDSNFSRELGRKGWLGLTLPTHYGGAGRSPSARSVMVPVGARSRPLKAGFFKLMNQKLSEINDSN